MSAAIPSGATEGHSRQGGADVVLQNARPGAMVRAGLGPQALRAATPRQLVGSVSGFGAATAYAGRVGLDIAAQAESGLMSLNGAADGDPIRVGYPMADILTAQALNSQRVAHRPELRGALSNLTSAKVCARLGAAGVVVAAVRDFSQVRQEPNGLTPGLFRPVHAAGLAPIELPGTPFRIDGLAEPPARVPGLGEHTDEILAELAR